MQSENIATISKRNPFAAHSLKTKLVHRISPPSVLLSIPSCIVSTYKSRSSVIPDGNKQALFISPSLALLGKEFKKSKTSFQLVNLESINALNIQSCSQGCMLFFQLFPVVQTFLFETIWNLFPLFAWKNFAFSVSFAVNRSISLLFAWKSSVRSVCPPRRMVNCSSTNNYQLALNSPPVEGFDGVGGWLLYVIIFFNKQIYNFKF
ncbi:MAG: hypothetical protein ACOYN6_14170, partial [Ignavibacteria bacterium]